MSRSMFGGKIPYPDLDTPLGRAWLGAGGVMDNVQRPHIEGDPMLKSEIARLANCVKVLCEIIEEMRHAK